MMTKAICVLVGGQMLKIQVDGKVFEFEDHPYCGPTLLNKRTGSPLVNQNRRFLCAASQWAKQGRRMEDGLCRWDHEPEPITRHMGGPGLAPHFWRTKNHER